MSYLFNAPHFGGETSVDSQVIGALRAARHSGRGRVSDIATVAQLAVVQLMAKSHAEMLHEMSEDFVSWTQMNEEQREDYLAMAFVWLLALESAAQNLEMAEK